MKTPDARPSSDVPPPLPGAADLEMPPPLPPEAFAPDAPPEDPAVVREVSALSDQGVALMQTQRAGEAETLLRQALALSEEKLGSRNPSTAVCLTNLGEFLSQNARYAEAEPILRRAVAAQENAAVPDLAELGIALNNLALALRRMERFAEAEPLYRRVLEIFEQVHGPDSMLVGGVLNNLSQLLQHTGRLSEAEPFALLAIGLFEKNLGADHPSVAIALNGYAGLLIQTGRAAEAEPISRRHLRIFQTFENTTGNPHAYKRAAVTHYAELLQSLGLSDEEIGVRIRAVLAGQDVVDFPVKPRATVDGTDFDQLARTANTPDATINTKNTLYAAAFRLKEWYFIARGEIPNVSPYIAANAGIAEGAPMLKAFTDAVKLQAFAKENGLTAPDGSVQMLTMPVAGIMPTLQAYAEQGVSHIHFNANLASDGFYAPITQMPAIREHLEKLGFL